MAGTEKRLSRWSRLKNKGGADEREETTVAVDKVKTEIAVKEAEPAAKQGKLARKQQKVKEASQSQKTEWVKEKQKNKRRGKNGSQASEDFVKPQ